MTETQNDDFGARYYSNRFGRWLSADWSNVPAAVPYANLSNPQTLNLYSMVADDPESFADLDGHLLMSPEDLGSCNPGGCNFSESTQASAQQQAQSQEQKPESEPLVSASVEGGFGIEGKANLGPVEGKIGGAIKGEVEVSSNGTKVSAKAEASASVGPLKLGGVQAEWITKNEKGKMEKPTLTITKPGIENGKSEATGGKDKVTVGASVYNGPGGGVSVSTRPEAILTHVAITAVVAIARYAAEQAF